LHGPNDANDPNDANSADYRRSGPQRDLRSDPPRPNDDSRSLVETLIKEQGRVCSPRSRPGLRPAHPALLELRLGDPSLASCSEGLGEPKQRGS